MWQKILVSLGIQLLGRIFSLAFGRIKFFWNRMWHRKETDYIVDRKKELKAQLKSLESDEKLSDKARQRLIDETKNDLNNIVRDSLRDYEL